MNSNSDYTICNLDNHTYTSNYSAESVSNSGGYGHGSYSVHNNGIVDTGQLGYGAAAAMHHGPGGGGGPDGLPPPPPSHHSTTTAAHHPPPPHLYQGTVLTAGSPPPGPGGYPGIHHGSTCMTGPAGHHGVPYGDYYPTPAGVITNGGLDCSTGGYPYPHHDPNGPCITTTAHGGYELPNHHHSQGQSSPPQDQTPVATYKWMTVKRNGPKPGKDTQNFFSFTPCSVLLPSHGSV